MELESFFHRYCVASRIGERMKYWFLAVGMFLLPVVASATEPIVFNRDIRPILSDRCFQCHGPNEHDRQAGLRLDLADGDEGALQVIEPGSVDDSELWTRITSSDDDRMPPPDSHKKPLSKAEQEVFRQWIEQGAPYTSFWAFVPPRKPALPEVTNSQWSQQPIDRFVLKRLESEGMTPNPVASRRTLIRRLFLDLTGLPPTLDELHMHLHDDSPDWYERLVDNLLDKPQYGEHMTKYWLDLVRFADTNGIHHDHYREMTPYRDWVIRALNDNLPYDQFLKYQLAGDLYPQPTQDQLIASGFNRLHLIIDVGTALPEESHARNVIDRVTAVGTAFMGLTVQCAVCHDHKYDPIRTKDFYQLYAFFNNIDAAPETGGRSGSDFERGLQPPYISLATDQQQAKLKEFDSRITEMQAEIKSLEQQVKEAGQQQDGDQQQKKVAEDRLKKAQQKLKTLQANRRSFEDTISFAMVMKERADPRPAHILIRGAYDNPGELVERDTPGFLPPMKKTGQTASRMDLADWFISADQPLTARVAVNRFWQQLFGVGIVKTSEDFGAQGEWPSHPELLDYLAVFFVESGWDVKALMKQMVMSATYRQSSEAAPEAYQRDPENRLLARGSRFRLDSEVIRDQVLATSGLLNSKMYGKSVKPPQPAGLWQAVTMPSSYPRIYQADTGDKIYRRSVYTFWKRGMPPPQMTIFNAPTREACIARRERTNTPLQALLLMNEPEFLKAARHLACRTIAGNALSAEDRLCLIYETITAQVPDKDEQAVFLQLVSDLESRYRSRQELADQLCDGVELPSGSSPAEVAAWTMLASTIYNLDITKTHQ